jgi:hypothetical protein
MEQSQVMLELLMVVLKYLINLDTANNPPKFNLIRATIPETEGYEISINNDYVWKAFH